ncbi:factor H binding family protein [Pseudomonas sp. S 311-6]|uniref:Factor H binding protein-like C-terminal domain-containing protein n=1 Tax=Kerstersia gyiorum TaxID=206506 RepID=A0A4Q7MXB4_9BURK|nr:factor H binding protein domain-containing protein [Kerstersia gyiorum]KAB0544898.1 hypothetical protein F7P85_00910 [Kerstersia gyiorum]MCO7635859.1 factor H binding family protein [Pseudomonas sp. S 311-6]MCR4157553.1 factor H binding family protein [Kerstersia gyiorum]RZS73404.1 hypothetical protein EV679_0595 [Kerstersia gyiorum]
MKLRTTAPFLAITLAFVAQNASAFNINDRALNAFVLDNAIYKGSFTYNSVPYTPGPSTTFNLADPSLKNTTTRITGTHTEGSTTYNAVYRVHSLTHSSVVGNILQGGADRSFVKEAVGVQTTTTSVLPTGSNKFEYTGKAFNHIVAGDGDFFYEIRQDGAGWVGEGSVANITGNRPGVGSFNIQGDLQAAAISAAGGKLSVSGVATLTELNGGTSLDATGLANSTYTLGIFGPNAEEVAGQLGGTELVDKLNGYALIGER